MSKTDPRIIKTLHQIDTALLENLRSHDFSKITIEMICATAMINRSTFYKYYQDKQDLLDKYLDRVLADFRQILEATDYILGITEEEQQCSESFRRSANAIYANRDTYRILWNAHMQRDIFREMIDAIRENSLETLQRNHQPDNRTAACQDLYARLLASNAMLTICWWYDNDTEVTVDTVWEVMNSNMRRGLFTTFTNII